MYKLRKEDEVESGVLQKLQGVIEKHSEKNFGSYIKFVFW